MTRDYQDSAIKDFVRQISWSERTPELILKPKASGIYTYEKSKKIEKAVEDKVMASDEEVTALKNKIALVRTAQEGYGEAALKELESPVTKQERVSSLPK